MNHLIHTLSTFGVGVLIVVLAIVVLTLFVKVMSWFEREGPKPESLSIRGVLKKETLVTVQMAGGTEYTRVRFVGYTSTDSIKTHIPHDLNGMVILEDEQSRRFLVRARDIRMIVIDPETNESAGQ